MFSLTNPILQKLSATSMSQTINAHALIKKNNAPFTLFFAPGELNTKASRKGLQ
jgi:hypothetical protein